MAKNNNDFQVTDGVNVRQFSENIPEDHPAFKRLVRGVTKEQYELIEMNKPAFPLIAVLHDNAGAMPTRKLIREKLEISFTDGGNIKKGEIRQWLEFIETRKYVKRVEKPDGVYHYTTPKGAKMAEIMHKMSGKPNFLIHDHPDGTMDLLPVDPEEVELYEKDGRQFTRLKIEAAETEVSNEDVVADDFGFTDPEGKIAAVKLQALVDAYVRNKITLREIDKQVRFILEEIRVTRLQTWKASGKTPPAGLSDPKSVERLVQTFEDETFPKMVAKRDRKILQRGMEILEEKGGIIHNDNDTEQEGGEKGIKLFFLAEDKARADILCDGITKRKLSHREMVELFALVIDAEQSHEHDETKQQIAVDKVYKEVSLQGDTLLSTPIEEPTTTDIYYPSKMPVFRSTNKMTAKQKYIDYLENTLITGNETEVHRARLIQDFESRAYKRIEANVRQAVEDGLSKEQILDKVGNSVKSMGVTALFPGDMEAFENLLIEIADEIREQKSKAVAGEQREWKHETPPEAAVTATLQIDTPTPTPTPLPPKERERVQEMIEETKRDIAVLKQQVEEAKTKPEAVNVNDSDNLPREQHFQNMANRGVIRRDIIIDLLRHNKKTREIAAELGTSQAVIFNEIAEISKQARERMEEWISQQLPKHLEFILNNLREVAVRALERSKDETIEEEERFEALSLAQETSLRILQVMTNPRMFAKVVLRSGDEE